MMAAAVLVPACGATDRETDPALDPFDPREATIARIHAAFARGELSCVELITGYLARIDAYDQRGPEINALITVNSGALDAAADLDRRYGVDPETIGPLHCIPVIVKDNFDTADLPTTGGSVTLAESYPLDDAFIVRRLREAGAIVLAKSNLTELARGGTTLSSLGGQTRNPYDLTRTPGGSSGGTGAAVAAGFGVLGTGSDTGQSIRSPASAQSLVGLRPTRGLVSRDGVIPNSSTQDEAGPITRTVEDAARMLDVIAGYDPADPITAFGVPHIPDSYARTLDPNGMDGARIGVVMDLFGRDTVHEVVNDVTESALARMVAAGATILRVDIPDFDEVVRDVSVEEFESKSVFNRYLADLGPNAPVRSVEDFIRGGGFHPSIRRSLEATAAIEDGLNDPEYRRRLLRREKLRQTLMTVFADHDLDALVYPHQRRLVAAIGEAQLERNGVLSNATGFPAITIPGGFSPPTGSAPLGVPVGIELLGPDWSEPTLLKLAFAFEHTARVRKPPAATPPLD
jgi:Asp-tRNA(Asn)/Glu-tRNA(Gln) amidotransferase A subunit family amidase